MLHVMKDLRRTKECLGGNAAPVEADAAQIFPLDDRGLESELSGPNGCDVASRTGANDDDVEASLSHCVHSDRIRALIVCRPSHHHQNWFLDQCLECAEQLGAERAVNRAMVG